MIKFLSLILLHCFISLNLAKAEVQIIENNIEIHSIYQPHKINFFGAFPENYQKLIVKIKGPQVNFEVTQDKKKKKFIAHGLYAGYNPNDFSQNEQKILSFLGEKGLLIKNIAFQTNDKKLFWGTFHLPKNSPNGTYEIGYYFSNAQGDILKENSYFDVKRDKLQNMFYSLAYDYPILNSLVVIILAVITTQIINFTTRKLRS